MARRRPRRFLDVLWTIALAVVLVVGAKAYLGSTYLVSGDSMNPNLYDGERVLINRSSPEGLPDRGDMVVFRYPLDPVREFVKRVIGLPGDEVEMRQGRVFVNGSFLEEGYRIVRDRASIPAVRVPAGALFVLGDNRPVSEDSRFFGFVPLADVKGEVILVYWPPTRIQVVGGSRGGS